MSRVLATSPGGPLAEPSPIRITSPRCVVLGTSVAFFDNLDEDSIDYLLQSSQRRHCSRGMCFCRQGETATTLYVLAAGLVKITGITLAGKEVLLEWIHPGDAFGLGAMLSHAPDYYWTASAAEDSEAFAWDKPTITQCAARVPRLYGNALGISLRRCHALQDRLESVATEMVEQRMISMALKLQDRAQKSGAGSVAIHISDEELAQMTGTNLFTVDRVINRWKRLGWVKKSRRRLLILEKDKLKAFTDSFY